MPIRLHSDLSLDIPSQFRQKRSKDQEPGPTCTVRGKFPVVSATDSLGSFFLLYNWSDRVYWFMFQTAYVASRTWKNQMKLSCTIAISVKRDRNPLRSSGFRSFQRQRQKFIILFTITRVTSIVLLYNQRFHFLLYQVLCLHLKRFHWTAFLRNKVDTYVEFPLKGLDMRCYLLEVSLNMTSPHQRQIAVSLQ